MRVSIFAFFHNQHQPTPEIALLGKSEELISFVTDRPGHDLRYAVDCSKIRAELGWMAKKKFTDGLENTVHFYIEQYGGEV